MRDVLSNLKSFALALGLILSTFFSNDGNSSSSLQEGNLSSLLSFGNALLPDDNYDKYNGITLSDSNEFDTENNSGNITDTEKINEFLESHNFYRSEVNSSPLVWSNELADFARAWGENLAHTGCNLEHRPNDGEWAQKYGENLYWSSGFAPSPKTTVDSWGSEKSMYDGGVMNENNFSAGHYTQMIWSQTTEVGCATVRCSDGSYIVVCNYNPAGNYFGVSPIGK